MFNGMLKWATCALLMGLAAGGCQSTYYKAWEKLGWAKRDILVDRVKDAREDEEAAKKQFQSALEQFQQVTHFQGGELEAKYKKLNKEYEASEARAADVRKRVKSVDDVAQARYRQMYAAMKSAEDKMEPVLNTFRTQVLYLKHNLNAAAIASLQTQVGGIQGDVEQLIRDMDASIKEADSFISQMK